MWFPLTFLLVGVAVATHDHAWQTGHEYQYLVRSRTLAGLDNMKEQYTGLQLKGLLTLQVRSPEKLLARFSNPQYARIHKELLNGPETEIPDQMLEYREMPMSGKPFEVRLKHGVIRDLMIDPEVPTGELNILKGIMSSLQVDTQGENAIRSKSTQIPRDDSSSVMFKAMEDSVGGKCEVLYEISPLYDNLLLEKLDKVPFRQLSGEESLRQRYYDIKKTKNYEKCQQRQLYHYGLYDPLKNGKYNKQGLPMQLSTSQIIISGDLKRFTIQSSVTKNQISINPKQSDSFLGTVYSIMKLTLAKRNKISGSMLESQELTNLESTGNLVYTYNHPFSKSEERRANRPNISQNSGQVQSSESSSSSETPSAFCCSNESNETSSSSSSNKKQRVSVLQPETALHMAPNVPLLPYFVGYNGKAIQLSDKVNVVDLAYNILCQITEELQNLNQISSQTTLEKYTILINLLRTMNHQQYIELEEQILRNQDKLDSSSRNDAWNTYYDVVSHAGTGPALLTMANWLKSKKVGGVKAARLLSQMSKNVREPTAAYLKTYFEMISDPLVSEQEYLNTSSAVAFGELIRNTYVGSEYYPTYSFDFSSSENRKEIIERYIPYLTTKLREGYSEGNSRKIQTYIIALGLTGHPKILSVLEPYLEGMEPATKFQRMLIVASLSTLAKYQPKLVGPIFYKLYSNKGEAHEVRCMAVHQFIISDPPMMMLQRVAKYTNYDTNEHVNSIVKTTMESIANTRRPEWLNLANKVRSVRNLLTPKRYNGWNSRGYYQDLEDWIVTGLSLKTVASDDSRVPLFAYLGINTVFDAYDSPSVQVGYAVSSIKQLFETFVKYYRGEGAVEEMSQRSRVEELAQTLQIQSEREETLEGSVHMNSIYNYLYYPFDSHTIQKIARVSREFTRKNKMDLTVFNNYEMTFSSPTESGLPYIYTMEVPTLLKLEAELKKGTESSSKQHTGIFNILYANKIQQRIGFLASFEHQHYLTGVDKNQLLQIPAEFEVKLDMSKQNLALKIRPSSSQTQTDSTSQLRMLQYNTIPFTTRQDLLELQPVSLNKNTQQVLNSKKQKSMLQRNAFSLRLETDNEEMMQKDLQLRDYLKLLKLQEPNGNYKKLELLLNTEIIADESLSLNVDYDTLKINTANEEYLSESSESREHTTFAEINWKPKNKERRELFLKGLSKSIRSGDVHVMDLSCRLPMLQQLQVLTIGAVSSNVDKKSKAYVYWNTQSLSNQEQPNYEVGYYQEIQYSPDTPLNFEYALQHSPRDEFNAQLRYGKSLKSATKIVAVGSATRSNYLKEIIENSRIAKQCRQETSEGNKALLSCQKAIEIAQVRDQYDFSFKALKSVQEIINEVLDYVSKYIPGSHIELSYPKNSKSDTVNVKLTMSPGDVLPTKLYLSTSQRDVTYRWKECGIDVTYPLERMWNRQQLQCQTNSLLESKVERDTFTLDNNKIVTFDKRVYPVTLGSCNHVIMITYPQYYDNHKNKIPENSKVAILAKDANDGSRIITVIMGNHEVQLMKSNNRAEAVVGGETLDLSRSYQRLENGETLFEIIRLPDESLNILSNKYGLNVVYDGKRVQISASDRYRSAIRGLAGNYDSLPDNDFLTPKNCVLLRPEEFAATYALIQENCYGPAVENRQKAEQSSCEQLNYYQTNVISDREAGRLLTEDKNWGYHKDNQRKENRRHYQQEIQGGGSDHEKRNLTYRTKVFEEDEELCFTTRPVPTCLEGTRPTDRKSKKYPLYCEQRNEESLAMKQRIEKGANPDLTRKPVSKSHVFKVPVTCNAA